MSARRAFTLFELMVVVAIICVLASMLFPTITVVRRQSAVTGTKSLLKRVENALYVFQTETGCLPYQDHASGYPEDNRLAWHLAHAMTAAESALLRADADKASDRYDVSASGGSMVITVAQVDAREAQPDPRIVHASIVNRAARQRARSAIMAGYATVTGLKFAAYDHSGTRLVPGATSQGLALNLLGADLTSREMSGDAIVDLWKRPLIYVCPVLPGARATWLPNALGTVNQSGSAPTVPFTPEMYGLQTQGRSATTALASSIVTTAAEPYRFAFELWSSGPDRRTAPMRDDADVRDDISATDYRRGLR